MNFEKFLYRTPPVAASDKNQWEWDRQVFGKEKRPEACDFIKKETLTQVFSCKFCKISRNTFFIEHLWWLLLKIGGRSHLIDAKKLCLKWRKIRSRHRRFSFKKCDFKNFANFIGKHLYWSLPTQAFPVKFAKFLRTAILKNTANDCFQST